MKKPKSKSNGKPKNGQQNGAFKEDPRSLEANIVAFSQTEEFRDISRKAVEEHRAIGSPITFLRGELIIRQHPDGREEIVGKVPASYRPKIIRIIRPK